MSGHQGRRVAFGARLLWWLAVGWSMLASGASPSPAQLPSPRPNILLIVTDDLDAASLVHLPRLQAQLVSQGTSFTNAFVNISTCCPSRASILRGQYAHNTQIFTNGGEEGGFNKFYRLGLERSTLATWLQARGYRTVLFGKYLNGYPGSVAAEYVPPGWDEWYSPVPGRFRYGFYLGYNYT